MTASALNKERENKEMSYEERGSPAHLREMPPDERGSPALSREVRREREREKKRDAARGERFAGALKRDAPRERKKEMPQEERSSPAHSYSFTPISLVILLEFDKT